MIEWTKRLRMSFGASFLWLICLIYFTQGFRSFVWTAVSYQLKDRLKLSPSASQFVFSIAFFPWSIKPLYGAAFAGDLQSMSWFSMAVGGICGSLLGGYALSNLEIHTIFLLFSVLPSIQLFSCGLVEEGSIVSDLSESGNSDISKSFKENGNATEEDHPLIEKSRSGLLKRKKSQKTEKSKASNSITSKTTKKDISLISEWYQSLKNAVYSLCSTFRRPIILRPMAWFFLALVTIPNLSTVMFYYQTEFLKLDPAFLGTARVVSWIGLMIGTFIYNRYLKKLRLRIALAVAHIGLAILTLLDMALVSRSNVQFGISDKVMVLFGSALSDAINQLKFMPFLILSGQLCPPGIEGTLFALFMSINNLGNTVGSFVGAGLASFLNISSGSFDNLLLGVGIQVLCTLVPVGFLFLIPKDATGVST